MLPVPPLDAPVDDVFAVERPLDVPVVLLVREDVRELAFELVPEPAPDPAFDREPRDEFDVPVDVVSLLGDPVPVLVSVSVPVSVPVPLPLVRELALLDRVSDRPVDPVDPVELVDPPDDPVERPDDPLERRELVERPPVLELALASASASAFVFGDDDPELDSSSAQMSGEGMPLVRFAT